MEIEREIPVREIIPEAWFAEKESPYRDRQQDHSRGYERKDETSFTSKQARDTGPHSSTKERGIDEPERFKDETETWPDIGCQDDHEEEAEQRESPGNMERL